MKKLFLLICISSIFWTSCKKDNSPIDASETFFSCKIDGAVFEGNSLPHPADNLVEGELNLRFISGDQSLEIGVLDFHGSTGTYTANWVHYDNGPSDFYGDMGSVTISEVNKKREFIRGSFSGTCSPLGGGTDMQITDGTFLMQYLEM